MKIKGLCVYCSQVAVNHSHFCEKHMATKKESDRASHLKNKQVVLAHYCHNEIRCQICGFSDMRALTIDHLAGGGCQHRRELRGGGPGFYRWLKQRNFPDGYQVLCMNCQFIKRIENQEIFRKPEPLLRPQDSNGQNQKADSECHQKAARNVVEDAHCDI